MAQNAQGKPSASDVTGSLKAKLEAERKDELARRAKEITLATEAKNLAMETEVLDVTQTPELPTVVDEVQVLDVEDEGVVIRVNEDLSEVTIGAHTYNFEAGKKYRVPRNVAFHLEEKNRVWH